VVTVTTAASMLGSSRTGSCISEAMPKTMISRLTTAASTGRRTLSSESVMPAPSRPRLVRVVLGLGRDTDHPDRRAVTQALRALDDDLLAGLESLDDLHIPDLALAQAHVAARDALVCATKT
jgi:hypothetical protein